jgi:deoxyribonuclease V
MFFLLMSWGWRINTGAGSPATCLALGKPTGGAAKNRLVGTPLEKEGRTLLVDKGEVIGEAVTTKQGAKSIYISVGHMVSLETAVEIAKHNSKGRIPKPLLQTHNLVAKKRNDLASESKVNI